MIPSGDTVIWWRSSSSRGRSQVESVVILIMQTAPLDGFPRQAAGAFSSMAPAHLLREHTGPPAAHGPPHIPAGMGLWKPRRHHPAGADRDVSPAAAGSLPPLCGY